MADRIVVSTETIRRLTIVRDAETDEDAEAVAEMMVQRGEYKNSRVLGKPIYKTVGIIPAPKAGYKQDEFLKSLDFTISRLCDPYC